MKTFDLHWDHVFEAIVSALTWEVESKTNMGNLENDIAAFQIITETNRLSTEWICVCA